MQEEKSLSTKKYPDFGWRSPGAAACWGWQQVAAGLLCSNAGSSGRNDARRSSRLIKYLSSSSETRRQLQPETIHLSIHHRKVLNTVNLGGFSPLLFPTAMFKVIPFLSYPSFAEAHPCSLCLWKLLVSLEEKKDKNYFSLLLQARRLAWGPAQVLLLGFHIALPSRVWTSSALFKYISRCVC